MTDCETVPPSSTPDAAALTGLTVHLTAHRRAEDSIDFLSRHGADVVRCPAMVPVPPASDEDLVRATERVVAERPDVLVVTTGVGLRGWIEAADQAGLKERLLGVLGQTRILARGSKAHGAVRAARLEAAWVSQEETAEDVIGHLKTLDLRDRLVALQYHGMGTDRLDDVVQDAGGTPLGVVVYRYDVPEDPGPVLRSLSDAAQGRADAVVFTAAGGAREWLRPANRDQVRRMVERSEAGDLGLFAVGPVTAAPLEDAGLTVLQPDRHRLGALLRLILAWGSERSATAPTEPATSMKSTGNEAMQEDRKA